MKRRRSRREGKGKQGGGEGGRNGGLLPSGIDREWLVWDVECMYITCAIHNCLLSPDLALNSLCLMPTFLRHHLSAALIAVINSILET